MTSIRSQRNSNKSTQELEDPTVWNDQKRAQDLGKEKKSLEGVVLTLHQDRRRPARRRRPVRDGARRRQTTTRSKRSSGRRRHCEKRRRGHGIPPHVQQSDGPQQLLHRHPGRRRRHRGPGLGLDAAAPVPALLRAQGLQGRDPGTVGRRGRRHQDRHASRSRASTPTATCAPRPACTAWCASRRSTRPTAATPRSPACSCTRKWMTRSTSRSTRPTCASTPTAHPAPAASTSTRPTPRCA